MGGGGEGQSHHLKLRPSCLGWGGGGQEGALRGSCELEVGGRAQGQLTPRPGSFPHTYLWARKGTGPTPKGS